MDWRRADTDYYTPAQATSGLTTGNWAYNNLIAVPFYVPSAKTADRIAVDVTVGGAPAGSQARLGIYQNGSNLYPGSLLLDAGQVLVDAPGIKSIVISQSLAAGLYWLAFVHNANGGAPTMRCITAYTTWPILGAPLGAVTMYVYWQVAFVYAPLPDPFPGGAAKQSYNNVVAVSLSFA
jgi:hypothetical protein